MPGPNDEQRDDLSEDEEFDETEDEATTDSEDKSNAEPPAGDAKRIADLMSKAQKEEARANKAERALSALRGEGNGAGNNDPVTQALMVELREASLDAVFGEYPELREYNIDRSLIEGSTRAEMRESATSLASLIKSVTTKARNKALADAGVKAESSGSSSRPRKSVTDMSDDEFLKMLDSIR